MKKNAIVSMALCALIPGFALAKEAPLLDAAASGFKDFSLDPGWTITNGALEGSSPQYYSLPETALDGFPDDPWTYFVVHPVNLWRYALAGEPKWTDYTLTSTVTIDQAAPLKGFRPGDYFFNYQWGREAIGSDAALLVRYQDPDNGYMVRLSSGYGHIELWKTRGGVVQVKPFAFKPGQAYKLNVTVSGRWITAAVDGTELIRYADPVLPVGNGRIGFGVRESRARFSDVRVVPAAHIRAAPPAHQPNFHRRQWVGRDYIFDGDEPVGFFKESAASSFVLCEAKLLPGLMPLVLPDVGMVAYETSAAGTYTVTKEGPTFAFAVKIKGKDDAFAGDAAWELSYDPARGYVWDKRATLTMLKDKGLSAWPELDDPYYYQIVAPVVTSKLPKCLSELKYCIKQVADGRTVSYPNAQHLWVDALGGVDTSQLTIRPGGANVTTVDGWGVVCELPADNDHSYRTGYCHWGLDQHLMTTNRHVPVKGDIYAGHVRYSLWDPARVRAELAHSVPLSAPVAGHVPSSMPLIAHVEPVNRCDYLVPGLTGEAVRQWTGNYTVDHTVGRGDSVSMRIDAAAISNRVNGAYGDERPNIWLGPSYWTGPFLAPRYRFGIWVKADQFTGKVIFQADSFNWLTPDKSKFPDIKVELPIQGKRDWTYLSFEAPFPRQVFNWELRIDPVGTGVIWVDDIEVTPLSK